MHQYYLFFCLLLGNSPLWASQAVLVVKNLAAIAGDVRDVGSNPESEDPLEEGMPIHSIILAWRTMDRGTWPAMVHWVAQSQTWLKWLSSSGPLYEYTTFILCCTNVSNCMLTFWGTARLFSKWLPHFPFPPVGNGCSNFSTSLSTLVVICCFGYNHPCGCEGIISLWFHLHFSAG